MVIVIYMYKMHIFVCVYIQCICLKKSLQFMIAVILHKCSLMFQEDLKPRRTFRWFRGDIFFSQRLRVSASCELRHKEPKHHPSSLCWVGCCSERFHVLWPGTDVGEKLFFKVPSLLCLRTLLIRWQNCCSIAVLSSWPCISVLRQYCDITSCKKSLPCYVLETDRGLCAYPGRIIYIIRAQV